MKKLEKDRDVFKARWKNPETSNHCFEGLLIVEINTKGEPIYVDTYWDGGGNKWFNQAEVDKQLDVTYYCNLNDYDLVNVKNAPTNYDDKDFIFMHSQHACSENCKRYYIKKDAVKSSTKMAESIKAKIERHERDIRHAQSSIEWLYKDLEKVSLGDLTSVYI